MLSKWDDISQYTKVITVWDELWFTDYGYVESIKINYLSSNLSLTRTNPKSQEVYSNFYICSVF